jgi:hypothetical protein
VKFFGQVTQHDLMKLVLPDRYEQVVTEMATRHQ